MNKLIIATVCAAVSAGTLFASPMEAVKKNQWATVHTKTAESLKGQTVPVLFIGASIMQGWSWSRSISANPGGLEIWNEQFKEFKPVNMGVSGDKVEHVLWRVTEGKQLDGYQVKIIVSMVGHNNIFSADTPEAIAKGIINLNRIMLEKQPEAKILQLSLLPYEWDRNNNVAKINEIVRNSADNKQIFFLDLTELFPKNDKKIPLLRDGVHPLPEGYKVMADRLVPELKKMLENK